MGRGAAAFQAVRDSLILKDSPLKGIGTLSEKAVHRIIKNYLEPDISKQEQPIGDFVADIYDGQEIKEIQTKNFVALKKKLTVFLEIAPVTIVHPIYLEKYINWVDPESGEIKDRRKSSHKGSIYDAMDEMLFLKSFLGNRLLKFMFLLLNAEEYRLLDGYGKDRKKRATKLDRIPTALIKEVDFCCPEDYGILLPPDCKEGFTAADYAGAAGIPSWRSQRTLYVLRAAGAVELVGKRGRSNLYRRSIGIKLRGDEGYGIGKHSSC